MNLDLPGKTSEAFADLRPAGDLGLRETEKTSL